LWKEKDKKVADKTRAMTADQRSGRVARCKDQGDEHRAWDQKSQMMKGWQWAAFWEGFQSEIALVEEQHGGITMCDDHVVSWVEGGPPKKKKCCLTLDYNQSSSDTASTSSKEEWEENIEEGKSEEQSCLVGLVWSCSPFPH